jgi:concanavalin A-like lectin/glucanase superfamily protein
MRHKNKIAKYISFITIIGLMANGCNKPERPALGDYPKDTNPPGGPLKFYVAFDGTTSSPLMNAVDSIRANFPSSNPLPQTDGVEGKATKGISQKAILYPSANDFNNATSFTIAFWEKNSVPTGGSPQFVFSLASKDYWHQSALFWLVDHDGAGSTADSAATSLVIQDNWFVTHDNEKLPGHILNGNWHHIAITYDETTSRISYYVDGVKVTNLSAASSTWLDGGTPHGAVKFANTYAFVLAGWNKHANLGNGAPTDDWIQSWQGSLDQFRLYNKVLTGTEILALYNSKL